MRFLIQPLGIVCNKQDRLPRHASGQKRQRRKCHQKNVGRSQIIAHAESSQQCSSLARNQSGGLLHQRAQCLLQGCKRQMDFGQDAGHAQYKYVAFTGSALGDLEERRFADPGLAADNECRSTLIDAVDQTMDQRDVLLSALQDEEPRSCYASALCLLR